MPEPTANPIIGYLISIIGLLLAIVGYFFKSLMGKFDELINEVKKLNIDNVQHGADIKLLKERSKEHTQALKEHSEQLTQIKIDLAKEDHETH